ncbi:hypothetical protein ABPG72_015889 [Tetrahymena utriculariae]
MQLRQQQNQIHIVDKNFQCLGCPMDIMCAFSQCDRGNTLFCFNCIQQKHENCNDHKWDQYACQITNWTEMIQDLKEKSYKELENSAIITAYEQLEVMKSTLVNALENMQSKIVEYCPSIKTYARVYSYKPDSDFITNFTLRKSLVFDPSKQSLKFKHPINSENVDFPHILTRKLILQAQDLQRNFSHQCKKFLIDIEEVDPNFQNFRNTLRGASKLAIKDIIKNQRSENYIVENFNSKQEQQHAIAKENKATLSPDTSKKEEQHAAEESATYMLRSRNKGTSMNLRTLKVQTNISKNGSTNNYSSNNIYNYPRNQSIRSYNQAIENKEITNGTTNLLNRKRRRFYREQKEERKLKILKDALKMGNILKAAKIHGVSGSVIRKWRKLYSGLPEIQEYNRIYIENRCAQEKYSAAEKKVILMELKQGSIKQSVANKYKIHPTTLRKWEKKFGKELGFKEFAEIGIEQNKVGNEDAYYDVKEEYSDEEAEDGDIDGDGDGDDDELDDIDIQIEPEDEEGDYGDAQNDGNILDHQSLVDNKNSKSVQFINDPNNNNENLINNNNNNGSNNDSNNYNSNGNNDNNNNNNNNNIVNDENNNGNSNNNNNNQPDNAKTQGNNLSIEDKNKDNNSQPQSQEKPQKKQQQNSTEQRSQMSLRTRRQLAADSSFDTKNSKANQSIDVQGVDHQEDSQQSVSQEVPNKELYKPHARFNKNLKVKEEDQSDQNQKRKTRSAVNQHL